MVAAAMSPSRRKRASRNPPAMTAMPAARPSMLSSRLNALVTPTIQSSVSTTSSTGTPVSRSTKSSCTRTAARAIWATSLTGGRRGRRSSTSPTAPIASETRVSAARRPRGSPTQARAGRTPSMIATPPSSATGRRCQRSLRGSTTRPKREASRSQMSVAERATISETAKATPIVPTGQSCMAWAIFARRRRRTAFPARRRPRDADRRSRPEGAPTGCVPPTRAASPSRPAGQRGP